MEPEMSELNFRLSVDQKSRTYFLQTKKKKRSVEGVPCTYRSLLVNI